MPTLDDLRLPYVSTHDFTDSPWWICFPLLLAMQGQRTLGNVVSLERECPKKASFWVRSYGTRTHAHSLFLFLCTRLYPPYSEGIVCVETHPWWKGTRWACNACFAPTPIITTTNHPYIHHNCTCGMPQRP